MLISLGNNLLFCHVFVRYVIIFILDGAEETKLSPSQADRLLKVIVINIFPV